MEAKLRVEILDGPDNLGRYRHIRYWNDEKPAYCLTCGACASLKCACYGDKKERGQVFFSELPKEVTA